VQFARLLTRAERLFNAPVTALARSPRWGWLVGGNIAMLTYTGRVSRRTVTLPVAYRRRGDEVLIGVNLPDVKTWWRNFLGDGSQLTLRLDGRDRTGHAVAQRDGSGPVTVTVRLEPG
jgi:hypothetical protein